MAKVSLQSQISAVDIFLNGQARQMTGARKSLHEEHMQAVRNTLAWLKQNEAAVREFVEQRKAGAR